MSRRYGRNQKRAHRAALATAIQYADTQTSIAVSWKGRYEVAVDRARDAESLMAEIALRIIRALGPDTALLPISLQPDREYFAHMHEAHLRGTVPSSPPSDIDGFSFGVETMVYNKVQLLQLILFVERHPRRFETLIRFMNINPSAGFTERGFCASRETMTRLGWMESDIQYFARYVVQQLTTMQKEDGAHG